MWSGACVVVILRKQWVDHERLSFPLGQVSLNLLGVKKTTNEIPMVQTRAFRAGIIISLVVVTWNIISYWGVVSPIPIMGTDLINVKIHP